MLSQKIMAAAQGMCASSMAASAVFPVLDFIAPRQHTRSKAQLPVEDVSENAKLFATNRPCNRRDALRVYRMRAMPFMPSNRISQHAAVADETVQSARLSTISILTERTQWVHFYKIEIGLGDPSRRKSAFAPQNVISALCAYVVRFHKVGHIQCDVASIRPTPALFEVVRRLRREQAQRRTSKFPTSSRNPTIW